MAVSAITADPLVMPVLEKLATNLASWFAAQPNPVRTVGVRWGTDYTASVGSIGGVGVDEACPGICWVRFVSVADGSRSFPGSGGLASPCGPAMWAVTVEIGVQRCAGQWPTGEGALPDEAQWLALVDQMALDMAVVRKAVQCTQLAPGQQRSISWGAQAPLAIEGNVTGSTVQVTVPVVASGDCVGC